MGLQALMPLWAKCAPVIVLGLGAYALLQAAEFSRQVRTPPSPSSSLLLRYAVGWTQTPFLFPFLPSLFLFRVHARAR